jgi:hypothetical protein
VLVIICVRCAGYYMCEMCWLLYVSDVVVIICVRCGGYYMCQMWWLLYV